MATGAETTVPNDICDFYDKMEEDEDDENELQTVSFEINQDHLEMLQKRLDYCFYQFCNPFVDNLFINLLLLRILATCGYLINS